MSYVSKRFKAEFLPQMYYFLSRLPHQGCGLPLNSGVSKALAPLIYIPLLLELRKAYNIRFMVFVDDFWIMCPNAFVEEKVYAHLHNALRCLGLDFNGTKVQSGRLGTRTFTFCGFRFAGGYISVSGEKQTAFKTRLIEVKKNAETSH